MARQTPMTARTITANSEMHRALNVVFMRDHELDPEERHILGLSTHAAGCAHWADWQRRARNSVEDTGHINACLLRERRELRERFGDDGSDAA